MYSEAHIQNLVEKNGSVVSEKSKFEFSYVTIGQGQEMTLSFNTHI